MTKTVIQKKICMLGSFAVGKTSLVSHFVSGVFSDKYLTTVGVKIDKKTIRAGDQDLNLVLWDLHGEDEFQKVQDSYLRGSAGCFLVVDGTRPATFDWALYLQDKAETILGNVPVVFLLNKVDLVDQWELPGNYEEDLRGKGVPYFRTSAKTGEGVEAAFQTLGELTLREPS